MDVAISRGHVAVAVLVFLGWAAAAHAEDAVQPPTPPAGTRTLADTPFRLGLPQGHLFGDWAGIRTWAEEHGITPTLTFVMDALGNPTGGMQQGFRQASNLGLDLRFDLDKLFGLTGGSFEISFSERFGSSLSKEDIGNVFTVQQVFEGQTYRLVDVAYQQQLLVTFLPLLNAVGLAGAYALYAVAAVSSLPFVLALVRETRGKTLEQM